MRAKNKFRYTSKQRSAFKKLFSVTDKDLNLRELANQYGFEGKQFPAYERIKHKFREPKK